MDTITLATRRSLSAAFVVGSGRPYTPASGVEAVWFPWAAAVNQVTFDSKNSARFLPYSPLDSSTERDFVIGSNKSSVSATVFNVYDQQNVSFYEYEIADQTLTNN